MNFTNFFCTFFCSFFNGVGFIDQYIPQYVYRNRWYLNEQPQDWPIEDPSSERRETFFNNNNNDDLEHRTIRSQYIARERNEFDGFSSDDELPICFYCARKSTVTRVSRFVLWRGEKSLYTCDRCKKVQIRVIFLINYTVHTKCCVYQNCDTNCNKCLRQMS